MIARHVRIPTKAVRDQSENWRSVPAAAHFLLKKIGRSGWTLAPLPITLVARRNFSRQNAELVDVPIANKHPDRGQYLLIAGVSLGVASSLLRSQTFEIKRHGWRISIVSHDPSPSEMQVANLRSKHGREWAPFWHNLGSSCSLLRKLRESSTPIDGRRVSATSALRLPLRLLQGSCT